MAKELVLVNGIWVLRQATDTNVVDTIINNVQTQAYDYVAPLANTTIRLTNFIETSTSGSYT